MSNRDRVIVWPLEAWAKARTEKPVHWEHLWFAEPALFKFVPAGFERIGWVQQGNNRGALLRSRAHGGYGMYDGCLRAVLSRKVEAALAAYERDPDAAFAAAMDSLSQYYRRLFADAG